MPATKHSPAQRHERWKQLHRERDSTADVVFGTPWEHQAAPYARHTRACDALAAFIAEHGDPPYKAHR